MSTRLALALLLSATAATAAAAVPTYTVTVLPDGMSPAGINNAGQIVGTRNEHAYLWSSAGGVDLGTLGGASSTGAALNRFGEVTGQGLFAQRRHDERSRHARRRLRGRRRHQQRRAGGRHLGGAKGCVLSGLGLHLPERGDEQTARLERRFERRGRHQPEGPGHRFRLGRRRKSLSVHRRQHAQARIGG
ncbi:hypothetical protein F2P46_15545 [Massilia sp. CCM 8734]|nr:hypothetical protein [Massilia sp. CCM 8734]